MRLPSSRQAQVLVHSSSRQVCASSSFPQAAESTMGKRRRSTPGATGNRNPNSAVGAPTEGTVAAKGQGSFRFWHDERRFKGPGVACVVQEALFAAGGVRTGGYPKAAPIPGPLGFQRPGDWDLLWSPARLALRAVPSLKPGQLISSSPGMMSLTRKRKLPVTLRTALGAAAWAVTPHSFVLPDEMASLQAHMASREAAGAGGELWILKTAQHLGKGLKLLPARELCGEAVKRHVCNENGKSSSKPYVLAQRYVDNPLLVQGRKFGIRVWVLVLGPNPMRAYLHANGLVLFATHGYDSSEWRGDDGSVALGHVTNYAQNVDGTVWDLEQLKQHLGEEAFAQLWDRIACSAAMMCSAAVANMRAEHAALRVPAESAFELLGLDYLVDTALHPWLLEVNGTPSLAVDHSQPDVEKLIHTQKAGMVKDMFELLNVSGRFQARYEAMRLAAKQAAGRQRAPLGPTRAPPPAGKTAADRDSEEEVEEGEGEEDAQMAGPPGPQQEAAAAGAGQQGTAGTAAVGTGMGARGGWAVGRVAVAAGGSRATTTGQGQEPNAVVLPRRLRDLLAPRSEQAIRARVAQELQQRGAFQPLMGLFPMPHEAAAGDAQQAGPVAAAGAHVLEAEGGAAAAGQGGSVSPVSSVSSGAVVQLEDGLQDSGGSATDGGSGGGGAMVEDPHCHKVTSLEVALSQATLVAQVPWSQHDLALRRTMDAAGGKAGGEGGAAMEAVTMA